LKPGRRRKQIGLNLLKKGDVEMKIKILVLVAVLVLCGLICSLGCVGKGKQAENKGKSTASIEATQASTQEMKTYISSDYGFSLSYPKYWAFEKDTDPRHNLDGRQSYCMYTDDTHRRPQDTHGIIIYLEIGGDVPQDIDKSLNSSDQFEALLKKYKFYANEKGNTIKKLKLDYDGYLIYDHYRNGPDRAIFYIPDKGITIGIDLESDYGTEEFLSVVYSIRKNANKR
jgi:hypothetical protein